MDGLTCYDINGAEACIDGPEDVGPYLLRVIWALAGISGLFLALRLYSKLYRRRPLWWDDCFLVAAWVSYTQYTYFKIVHVASASLLTNPTV